MTEPKPPTGPASRLRDLAMGARFAVIGGREGWLRTALTAAGVGLGVALLMIAASVPQMLSERDHRESARSVESPWGSPNGPKNIPRGSGTLLYDRADTDYREQSIAGTLLRPEGPKAPVPPGLKSLPGQGEMAVSPALDRLLSSTDGKLLRERLNYRTVGTIENSGLIGPNELFYYAGSDRISIETGARRIDHFGFAKPDIPLNPVLIVLLVMVCVVLLIPVGAFIATAVRFGGERRDRRLAALRLIGADSNTVRRIAAGEALCGAVLGLAVGALVFLLVRQLADTITIRDTSVFPSDIVPSPWLTVLIVLAVPACAILVTQAALRGIAIEPLGVVRSAVPRRRRLWWRLLIPAAGLALLIPLFGRAAGDSNTGAPNTFQVGAGAVLLLIGVTAVLPWLVEAVVARFRGGPVPLQLAVRRLQLSSGPAARAVSGITVAVAGAIAMQMMLTGVEGDFEGSPAQPVSRSQLRGSQSGGPPSEVHRYVSGLRSTPGVEAVTGYVTQSAGRDGNAEQYSKLIVGDCATLRELASLDSCREGDTFLARSPDPNPRLMPAPGTKLKMDSFVPNGRPRPAAYFWTVPASARTAHTRPDPVGEHRPGVLVTPSAIDVARMPTPSTELAVKFAPNSPDAPERVRNTIARVNPAMHVYRLVGVQKDGNYAAIERGLLIGAVGTLTLIGASLLVTTLEQLRERKRLLSVLVAFGTRRRALAWSVLWQTAIPMALGMAVAVAGGLTLGWSMLRLGNKDVRDWWAFLPMIGTGTAVIALVTLISLPPLVRMMRPDGLRTE